MILPQGRRDAYDEIYLNENYFKNEKEIHKFVGNLIAEENRKTPCKVLDIGCAVGERIHYLQQRFPQFSYLGIDYSEAMIDKARKSNPHAKFQNGSILDLESLPCGDCDITICGGVLAIFDDIGPPIHNLVSTMKSGGVLYISDTFNNEPIDVVMRYRRVHNRPPDEWESGWNVFSKITVEHELYKTGLVQSLSWHDFRIPFALPKRDDVMRTWTIKTDANPYQIVNGAAQILDVSVVRIKITSH